MIAANKHGGEWDRDLLSVAISEVGNVDLTGFTAPELADFNIEMPNLAPPTTTEESDEQYVANTPETTEQIPTENPNENVKQDFDGTEEKTEMAVKRFVIIVDCPDEDTKQDFRKKIQPLVEKAGLKLF